MNCIFRNTVSKSGRAAEFTLGKQCLRLSKLDEQGDFRHPEISLQCVKKASQSLPSAGGKGILIIFCRGTPQGGLSCPFGAIHLLYLTENTTQAASVRFVRQRRTNRARGRLQSFSQKRAKPFFDSLSGHPSGARSVCKTSLAEFAALS